MTRYMIYQREYRYSWFEVVAESPKDAVRRHKGGESKHVESLPIKQDPNHVLVYAENLITLEYPNESHHKS